MSASCLMWGDISDLIGVGWRRDVKGDTLCTQEAWSEFALKNFAEKTGMREREEERKKEIFLGWVKLMGLEGTGVKVCVSGPDLSHAHGQGGVDLGTRRVKQGRRAREDRKGRGGEGWECRS